MWRLWAAAAGAPVGVLLGLALLAEPSALALGVAAALGGLGLGALVSWLPRATRWETQRGSHLARAASAGWVAVPAVALVLLDLPPGPVVLSVAVLALLGGALFRATRATGVASSPGRHAVALALGGLVAAGVAVTAAAGLRLLAAAAPADPEVLARAAWDIDATVPLGPLRVCTDRVRHLAPLLDRGAHPRLASEGHEIWFDAEGPDGHRQVYRLDRDDGTVRCATCEEPGDNRRPAPHPSGTSVVFDTDRHATLRHPANTEIHVVGTRSGDTRASRRLTHDPAPDDHALYDPSGRGVVWSHGSAAGYAVVRAPIVSGHGSVRLGAGLVLVPGGLSWTAPLAWSPDARSLAVARGDGLGAASALALDPATGERRPLGRAVAGAGSVSFSADGTRTAVAETRASGAASLVPAALGFLVRRVQTALDAAEGAGPGGTIVRVGETGGELGVLALGDAESWGEPSGLSLAPAGDALVLGQHRTVGGALEERLVWIELDCASAAP